jgi:hypothetical protein
VGVPSTSLPLFRRASGLVLVEHSVHAKCESNNRTSTRSRFKC